MKKRNLIRPSGILRWSTAFILAGGVAGLSSCDRPAEDSQAAVQARVDEPDPVQKQLETGMVENNFHLPKVGYYHAAGRKFHEFSYNQYRDDRYYVNGDWQAGPGPSPVEPSRPLPEELKRVEAALEQEQKAVAQNPQGGQSGGGMGMGNMLMMYWLLSGNRDFSRRARASGKRARRPRLGNALSRKNVAGRDTQAAAVEVGHTVKNPRHRTARPRRAVDSARGADRDFPSGAERMKSGIRLESNAPRADWQRHVEEAGLLWHGTDGAPYWMEDRHLVHTLKAAETLEDAAAELHALCLEACEEIVKRGWWERLAIGEAVAGMVQTSWMAGDFSLYGRFDLAWDGRGTPKLLEYNADTPTSLLEAAVIQWQWLEAVAPGSDQLNSIHEALVERWKLLPEESAHFACAWDMLEDRQTIAYLAETAEQAGKSVELMNMPEIGFSPESGCFTDLHERPIERLFKLYPWEWMVDEPFFAEIGQNRARFIEPMWKMMLSNKGLLAILWELNPGHPLLLPAHATRDGLLDQGVSKWVEKPFFGREGAGISIMDRGGRIAAGNAGHEGEPLIYQKHSDLFQAEGWNFVWGLWMVGDECRGLSARGDTSPVTGNLSRFFPIGSKAEEAGKCSGSRRKAYQKAGVSCSIAAGMAEETLVIASAANEKFAIGVGVMMCSAVQSTRREAVHFHIVDGGILPETRQLLLERLMTVARARGVEVKLDFIDFNSIRLPDLPTYFGSLLPYSRMFLPDLLDVDELFYVDADIICNRDFPTYREVRALHPGKLVAAAHDPVIRDLSNDCPWLDHIAENERDRLYVNTGFMWMDLEGLRKFRLREKFEALAEGGTAMKFADQTAINFLLRNDIGLLDPDFNRFISLFCDPNDLDPGSNLHFVGPEKPWIDPDGKALYLHYPIFEIAARYFGFTGPALEKLAGAKIPMRVHYHIHVRLPVFFLTGSKRRFKKWLALKRRLRRMNALRKRYRGKFQSFPPLPASPAIPGGVP